MARRAAAPARAPALPAIWRSGRSERTRRQCEVYSAVLHLAEQTERGFVELLRPHQLSLAQYNVLRVLRGAGPPGLSCGEIGTRLIRHDPDLTRLIDRLLQRGLVERVRDAADRRVVRAFVTPAGLELLASLDRPFDDLHEAQFGHLSERRLGELLTRVREAGAKLR